jgi:hypothetical protein
VQRACKAWRAFYVFVVCCHISSDQNSDVSIGTTAYYTNMAEHLTQAQLVEFQESFKVLDKDEDGVLSAQDLQQVRRAAAAATTHKSKQDTSSSKAARDCFCCQLTIQPQQQQQQQKQQQQQQQQQQRQQPPTNQPVEPRIAG